jgi:hypothetical protein
MLLVNIEDHFDKQLVFVVPHCRAGLGSQCTRAGGQITLARQLATLSLTVLGLVYWSSCVLCLQAGAGARSRSRRSQTMTMATARAQDADPAFHTYDLTLTDREVRPGVPEGAVPVLGFAEVIKGQRRQTRPAQPS